MIIASILTYILWLVDYVMELKHWKEKGKTFRVLYVMSGIVLFFLAIVVLSLLTATF